MAEFDYITERCVFCDGHWRHYSPCPYIDTECYTCGQLVPKGELKSHPCKVVFAPTKEEESDD